MTVDAQLRRIDVGDGQAIAVRDIGQGQPIVLAHGIPGSAGIWDTVVAGLRDEYRVLVVDLLGFGASTRGGNSATLGPANQARAAAAMLDALELADVAWVGHDYGGVVGLELARSQPERIGRLLLAATNTFPDTPIPFPLSTVTFPLLGKLFSRIVFSSPSMAITLRMGVAAPNCKLDRASYLGDRDQTRAIGTIFVAALRNLSEWYAPIADSLATIKIPTAVVWGDRDPFFAAAQGRRTADAIPGSSLTLLESTGHFIPAERPAELTDVIRRLFQPR